MANCIDPCIYFSTTVDLHAREVDEITIGTHPADVRKVGCRTSRECQHHSARNPAPIDKCETDVPFAKKCYYSLGHPSAVPKFDCKPQIGRELAHKIHESGELVRLEVRTELNQNRSQLLLELPRT